jgi:hypothetical protein
LQYLTDASARALVIYCETDFKRTGCPGNPRYHRQGVDNFKVWS